MSRISAAAEDGRDCVVVVTDLFATAFLRTTWLRKILGEKTAFLKDEPSPSDLVDIIVKQFKRYLRGTLVGEGERWNEGHTEYSALVRISRDILL